MASPPVPTIKQETITITLADGKGTILIARKGKDYKTVGVLGEFTYTANGIMQILDAIAATRLAVVAQIDAAAATTAAYRAGKGNEHVAATAAAKPAAVAPVAAEPAAEPAAEEEPEPETDEPAAAEEEPAAAKEPTAEEETEEEPDAPDAASDQGTLF